MIDFYSLYCKELLNEGGAGGHMSHPFDLPSVRNGNDLITFFNKAVNVLAKQPASLKIDGVNVSFKLVTNDIGEKEFALDRGSMKPLDVAGITIDKLQDRFGEGHGMVRAGNILLTIMNNALPLITKELKSLGLWNNPNKFLNTEFVEAKTNVQEYDHNFLAIHGVNIFNQITPTRRASEEVSYKAADIKSLVEKLNPIAKAFNFLVYGSVPATMSLDSSPDYVMVLQQPINLMYDRETIVNKTLNNWLSTAINPRDKRVKTLDGKQIGALSKFVYLHAIEGKAISDIVGDDKKAQQLCADGTVIYHATRVLGRELLAHIQTPMGTASDHEGIVLRDKSLGSNPVKITGDFIVRGMDSAFRA